jgi:hypothetical protein
MSSLKQVIGGRIWPISPTWVTHVLLAAVVAALIFHALFPRYEWHASTPIYYIRYDRWTGDAVKLPYEQR